MNPPLRTSLRRKFRALRRTLDASAQHNHAIQAARHFAVAGLLLCFDRFAIYWASDGELDTDPIARRLLAARKTVALPVVQSGRRLAFRRYHPATPLMSNRFGIPEPDPYAATPLAAAALDVVMLPLVAFDDRGNRLGMGGGYYDATLANRPRALRIGLAHELQRCDALPSRAWDVPLDAVITESGGRGFTMRGRRFFPE